MHKKFVICSIASLAVLAGSAMAETSTNGQPDSTVASAATTSTSSDISREQAPIHAVVQPVLSTVTPQKKFGVVSKFGLFAKNTYSPRMFLSGALNAGIPNIGTMPERPQAPTIVNDQTEAAYQVALDQYSTAMDKYRRATQEELRYRGRRFIGGFAEQETQNLLSNFVLPTALRQDPRYHPAASGHNFGYRFAYAVSRLAVTQTDSGRNTVNASRLLGTAGAAAAANYWYYPTLGVPQLHNTDHMMKTIGINLGLDGFMNIMHEFMPHHHNQ